VTLQNKYSEDSDMQIYQKAADGARCNKTATGEGKRAQQVKKRQGDAKKKNPVRNQRSKRPFCTPHTHIKKNALK
jgi:hypothetical protein